MTSASKVDSVTPIVHETPSPPASGIRYTQRSSSPCRPVLHRHLGRRRPRSSPPFLRNPATQAQRDNEHQITSSTNRSHVSANAKADANRVRQSPVSAPSLSRNPPSRSAPSSFGPLYQQQRCRDLRTAIGAGGEGIVLRRQETKLSSFGAASCQFTAAAADPCTGALRPPTGPGTSLHLPYR